MQTTISQTCCTVKQVQAHLARTGATSIGDVETLAGINVNSAKERHDLWWRQRHLFQEPGTAVWDAVQADLLKTIAQQVNNGKLSLFNARALGQVPQ